MQVVYVDGPQPQGTANPSIFLAGPTPQRIEDISWRPEALRLLQELAFGGTVFVPERSDWLSRFEYDQQCEWEWRHLHASSAIVFWVPRRLPAFPALTTNVEFGRYVSLRPTRCVYGRPVDSEKNRYLDWLYTRITGRTPHQELRPTLTEAIEIAQRPSD